MAIDGIYMTGTVSVTNGSKNVVFSGSALVVNGIMQGDTLNVAGTDIVFETITDDLHAVLLVEWPGATASDVTFYIKMDSWLRSDIVTTQRQIGRIVNILNGTGYIYPVADGETPDISLGEEDQYALDLTNLLLWKKVGGVWTGPASLSGGGGISDGDKGDITVSGLGTTWTIDAAAVTYAKIQNVSATDKLLGRSTAGAGSIEEIACTSAGRALIDDADASAQRTTLGLDIGTTIQAYSARLADLAGITWAQGDVIYYDGANLVKLVAGTSGHFLKTQGAGANPVWDAASGGVSDGDKGDITVSSGGATWTIDAAAVTYAKIQNVSATDKLLGRSTAGAGSVEEIACTAAGRALIDDADASAQRTTLGLVIGTNVQAYDAQLADLAGITWAQGDVIYYNGTNLVNLGAGTNGYFLKTQGAGANPVWAAAPGGGGATLGDGDYGDITVSSSGTVMTIDNDVVTYAKMQNVSATDKLLGRATAGAGSVEEITCTPFARTVLDDADAATVRGTLGLGTSATYAVSYFLAASNNLSDLGNPATARSNLGAAPTNDPTFTGTITLPTAFGINSIAAGTGDGASFTTYNVKFQSWWGIGFCAYEGVVRAVLNTRDGTWNVLGGYQVNGASVYYSGGTDVPVSDGGTGASDAATARSNLGVGTGNSPQFASVELGHASDTTLTRSSAGILAVEGVDQVRTAGNQNLTGGFTATSYSGGSITGAGQTYTPNPVNGNKQHITLNGSSLTGTFTFAAPSSVTSMDVEVVNGGSGAVGATLSTSGYTKVTGDAYATTNGNKYIFYINKTNSYSHLHITALQ